MDRLDAMQVLLTVVDTGSLSAGSRKLNAPLPSVSRKVAELERHLGTRLLIRTSRHVRLTDAGRDYVDAARQIVTRVTEAEQRASGEYQVPRGELTVTASIQFGQAVVAPLAYEFLVEHPEISLNMLLLDRQVHLIEEHIDIGVRVGTLEDSSLFAIKIGDLGVVTCASPDYLERKGWPLHPDDLAAHDGVIFGQINETPWVYVRNGQESRGMPHIRARVNMPHIAVNAALQGVGITRVVDFMVADELRSGALVRLLDDYDRRPLPVHFVYVRQGPLPLKVRAFLDWMTPRLRKKLKLLSIAQP